MFFPVSIALRDTRILDVQKSIIGLMSSNLYTGNVYAVVYTDLTFSAHDSNIGHVLNLQVKASIDLLPGSKSISIRQYQDGDDLRILHKQLEKQWLANNISKTEAARYTLLTNVLAFPLEYGYRMEVITPSEPEQIQVLLNEENKEDLVPEEQINALARSKPLPRWRYTNEEERRKKVLWHSRRRPSTKVKTEPVKCKSIGDLKILPRRKMFLKSNALDAISWDIMPTNANKKTKDMVKILEDINLIHIEEYEIEEEDNSSSEESDGYSTD